MKKVKGIVISILVAFVCILAMPFSVVNADGSVTISKSNIVGVSVVSCDQATVFMVVMDNYYTGNIQLTLNVQDNSSTNTTVNVYFYMNGNVGYGSIAGRYPIVRSIKSLDYQNLALTTRDRNTFPMESLNFIIETAGLGYVQQEMLNLGTWTYPIFSVPANSEITHRYLNPNSDSSVHSATLILWINKNVSSLTNISEALSITGGEFTSVESLRSFSYNGVNATRILKIIFSRTGNSTGNVYVRTVADSLIMPIYCQRNGEMGLETQDFCDLFGLPYGGLDNQSQESVDNLEDTMSDFTQASDDVISVENTIGSGFENSLEDIPTSFNFTNQFGASFISSAQWVRDQFNSMTVNNPFGSLITFSLILGVGLLLLGRKLL